jgi:hypothetical protein
MPRVPIKNSWLAKLMEPKVDFFAMLSSQASTTLAGVVALEEWINNGAHGRCQKVRDLENEADELKLELGRKLAESFITPIDREDLYDLSGFLDEVINSAKAVAREIEAMEIHSGDPYLKEMATTLVEGTRCVHQAFMHLNGSGVEAANQAMLACKSETRFSKIYRKAMRELFQTDDFKLLLKTREVYFAMSTTATKVERIGEKLAHVIVKIT